MFKTVVDYLVYLAVRILICIVQALPPETFAWIAKMGGWLAHDVFKIRRKIIEENLKAAFPEKSDSERRRLGRKMWVHLFNMIYGIGQARRKLHETTYNRMIHFPNRRGFMKYLLSGRPTVLISAHYGNFEVGGYLLGVLGLPTYTVARTLDNPYLDQFLNEFRSGDGCVILPKQGSAEAIQGVLERGEALTLLGDQYAGPKGCWVDFFNRPASCHKAVALFTLVSKAPLVTIYIKCDEKNPLRFEIGTLGAADPEENGSQFGGVKELTQWYSDRFAEEIRRSPEQYWWLHDRWKQKPKKAKAAEALRADGPHADVPAPHETATAPKKATLFSWLRGEETPAEVDHDEM